LIDARLARSTLAQMGGVGPSRLLPEGEKRDGFVVVVIVVLLARSDSTRDTVHLQSFP